MGGYAAGRVEGARKMKSFALMLCLILVAFQTVESNSTPVSSQLTHKSLRAQLENKLWEMNIISGYPEMLPEDYFTVEFNSGDMTFGNMCGGFWGKYYFESDDVVWLEMWDLSQNACSDLIKLPDGSMHEKMSAANYIQIALKQASGRYYISQSDEYNIELSKTRDKHVSLGALGFSRGRLQ